MELISIASIAIAMLSTALALPLPSTTNPRAFTTSLSSNAGFSTAPFNSDHADTTIKSRPIEEAGLDDSAALDFSIAANRPPLASHEGRGLTEGASSNLPTDKSVLSRGLLVSDGEAGYGPLGPPGPPGKYRKCQVSLKTRD